MKNLELEGLVNRIQSGIKNAGSVVIIRVGDYITPYVYGPFTDEFEAFKNATNDLGEIDPACTIQAWFINGHG